MYLDNAWYQVGWSHEVGADGVLARTIMDQPIVVFRDGDGKPLALHDMCPHRFAPLSRGSFADGVVTCGYHGLSFGKDGSCVGNPHGPIPRAAVTRAYPVLERHRALWIWMGDPDQARADLLPDLSFIDECPETGRVFGYLPTKSSYLLVSDNIMDLSHADYLHPLTLGGMMTGAKVELEQKGDAVFISWDSPGVVPPAAFAPLVEFADRADIWTTVLWQAPAIMVLSTGADPVGASRSEERSAKTLHNAVPETATSCHYFYCATRHFLLDPAFSALLKQTLDQAFDGEDKPMLEAQQNRMGDRDFWDLRPVLLSIDSGPVRARRVLERLISQAKA